MSRTTRFHFAAPLAFVMNRKRFDSLPPAAQEVIRKHSGERAVERFIEVYDANNVQALNDLESDTNRHVITPPRAELDALRATFQVVFEKWRTDNPRNAHLLSLLESEVAKTRAGN